MKYGEVYRDTQDGEVVMIVSPHELGEFGVFVLVEHVSLVTSETSYGPAVSLTYRLMDSPDDPNVTWEKIG